MQTYGAALVQVGLGNVRAQCRHCRSASFVTANPGDELTEMSSLKCAACNAPTTHAALVLQIADQALREARERLKDPHLLVAV
jgi:hypothetical protein